MDTTLTKVQTVNNVNHVKEQVQKFLGEGYDSEHIYVLAHDKDTTDRVAEQTDTEQIGLSEEGLGTAIANIFRSRGDELRAKMRSMGVGKTEAERLERELDQGRLVVIAWGGKQFENDDFDPNISYYQPYIF